MRFTFVVFALAAVGAFVLLTADEAAATHYRFGVLSWEPTGEPNEVRFTGGQAWRRSAFGNPNVGQVIAGESCMATGDGACKTIRLRVTTVSVVNDYFVARFVGADGSDGILHTYPAPNNGGVPWIASFSSCCRISLHSSGNFHVNNPDQSERLETTIDLSIPNSSPQSLLPPINPCPQEGFCSFAIPHVDADGDDVSFRLATTGEAGDAGYKPPGPPQAPNAITLDAEEGILTWDTHGAIVSNDPNEHTLYSLQVVLQDGKSKVPLDFFIELTPGNLALPYWATPPSPCGETLYVGAGNPLAFTVRAQIDEPRNVTINHLGIPTGASFSLPPPGNPAEGTLTWTPRASQVGGHLILFTAEDTRGYAAPVCSVTVVVVRGNFAARGLLVESHASDGAITRLEAGDVREGDHHTAGGVDAGAARAALVDMRFGGGIDYTKAPAVVGFARAQTTAGVVEVPGLLRAQGVRIVAHSLIDQTGAESYSEISFASLSIAGFEVDVSTLGGGITFVVPGVATVYIQEEHREGDGVNNANLTAHAIHVVFEGDAPVRELYLVSASADVGRDVEPTHVPADDLLPPLPPPPPLPPLAAHANPDSPRRVRA